MTRRTEVAIVRVCGVMLRLFPHSFRTEFGDDITSDVIEATDRLLIKGSRRKAFGLWLRYCVDAAAQLGVQWFRTGVPTLVGISAVSSMLLMLLVFLQAIPTSASLFIPLHIAWLAAVAVVVTASVLAGRYHASRF